MYRMCIPDVVIKNFDEIELNWKNGYGKLKSIN